MKTVRIKFEKFGRAKYISHLDLNRFMLKIVRRSGIPVWYSEGFNPHPYITFALPLSLGFDSKCEYMDIRLVDDTFSNENVFDAIKDLMPEGIRIVSCNDPEMKAGDISFAEYKIAFDTTDKSVVGGLLEFLSGESILTEKKTKKGTYKDIDLKEFIKGSFSDENSLTIILSAGGSNNLNPKLVLDAFEKSAKAVLPYYQITRTILYNFDMKEFK